MLKAALDLFKPKEEAAMPESQEALQEAVVSSVSADVQSLLAENQSLQAQLTAALAEAAEAKAAMASYFAEAAAKEVDARKARLSAVYGDVLAESMFAAIGDLPQEKFEAVVSAAEAANAAQATSPLCTEMGVSEEPVKAVNLSHAQQVAAVLAANLAKQHTPSK
jgi:hypothetical protein